MPCSCTTEDETDRNGHHMQQPPPSNKGSARCLRRHPKKGGRNPGVQALSLSGCAPPQIAGQHVPVGFYLRLSKCAGAGAGAGTGKGGEGK